MWNPVDIFKDKDSKNDFSSIPLIRSALTIVIFGSTTLIIYSLAQKDTALVFSVTALIGGASIISGFFLGFLFGIPKYKESPNSSSNYSINSNLTEIADWLTKIIVGLGLIQLRNIPHSLESIGLLVARCLGPSSIEIITCSCIIYFGVFGVYYGYNYARLVLSPRYKNIDNHVILEEKLEKVIEELNYQHDANQETFLRIISEQNALHKASTNVKWKPATLSTLEAMLKVAQGKMEKGKENYKNVEESEKDPQKGMWGGSNIRNNRRLHGTVTSMNKRNDLFKVILKVDSTDPESHPLEDGEVVLFALYHTYNNPFKIVVVKDHVAQLELVVYGAFTVGALVDEGKTELEFDMTTIYGAPKEFIDN